MAAGVPLDMVGELLRYARLTTSSQYMYAGPHRVAHEMCKLRKQLG
jgi:hypothetical protein